MLALQEIEVYNNNIIITFMIISRAETLKLLTKKKLKLEIKLKTD